MTVISFRLFKRDRRKINLHQWIVTNNKIYMSRLYPEPFWSTNWLSDLQAYIVVVLKDFVKNNNSTDSSILKHKWPFSNSRLWQIILLHTSSPILCSSSSTDRGFDRLVVRLRDLSLLEFNGVDSVIMST